MCIRDRNGVSQPLHCFVQGQLPFDPVFQNPAGNGIIQPLEFHTDVYKRQVLTSSSVRSRSVFIVETSTRAMESRSAMA